MAATVSLVALRRDLSFQPTLYWLRALLRKALSAASAGLMESARPLVEMQSIMRSEGAVEVGIFNHARLYYSLLMQIVNSVGYALWPLALQEARNRVDNFKRIGRIWDGVYFLLTAIGITLSFFAPELINLLTNGKFVAASLWVPVLVAYLLIQNSGKAATAILYVSMRGSLVARFRAATVLCAILWIFALGYSGSIAAVICIAFLEIIAFRLLLQIAARRFRQLPFQDTWVVSGVAVIISLTLTVQNFDILHRTLLFALFGSLLVWIGRRAVIDAWSAFRELREY
jgi:O-antigen/teichoic acid export membrane protein